MEDFAHRMRWLVDEAYPEVPVVRLVLDNLNTHRMASLYQTFPAAEARRIAKRLEFHYTPKHGSWLNMACPGVGRGRRLNSACWPEPACAGATATGTAWSKPSTPASRSATRRRPRLTGDLPPRRPEPNSAGYTLILQL